MSLSAQCHWFDLSTWMPTCLFLQKRRWIIMLPLKLEKRQKKRVTSLIWSSTWLVPLHDLQILHTLIWHHMTEAWEPSYKQQYAFPLCSLFLSRFILILPPHSSSVYSKSFLCPPSHPLISFLQIALYWNRGRSCWGLAFLAAPSTFHPSLLFLFGCPLYLPEPLFPYYDMLSHVCTDKYIFLDHLLHYCCHSSTTCTR